MTQQKALKRRVRARMAKTGERYTAARRQLVDKLEGPPATPSPAVEREVVGAAAPPSVEPGAPAAAEPTPAEVEPVPDSPFRGGYGASDEALLKRTGHAWDHWYRQLDAWGAAGQPHPAIARWLHVDQGVDGWWAQELTVRYEMAIGRRVPGQRPDGFEVSASRTFGVPVERLYDAVVDDAQRASWLGRAIRLRTAKAPGTTKAPASARFDWEDPSQRVVMWFLPKGERSTLSLAHQRMPDAETADATKLLWRDSLASLGRFLEG